MDPPSTHTHTSPNQNTHTKTRVPNPLPLPSHTQQNQRTRPPLPSPPPPHTHTHTKTRAPAPNPEHTPPPPSTKHPTPPPPTHTSPNQNTHPRSITRTPKTRAPHFRTAPTDGSRNHVLDIARHRGGQGRVVGVAQHGAVGHDDAQGGGHGHPTNPALHKSSTPTHSPAPLAPVPCKRPKAHHQP